MPDDKGTRQSVRRQYALPQPVFSADWLRGEEPNAAQQSGTTLYGLMQRAGDAAFALARRVYPDTRHWLVLCGRGNNGGDGYVVATRARAAGITVTLVACSGRRTPPEEACQARQAWRDCGGEEQTAETPWPTDIDLIIDGLLGTGLCDAPRAPYDELISRANGLAVPIVALDVPSGLSAETGACAGAVIDAACTVTFIALKAGLLTGRARACVGQLYCDELGLSDWLAQQSAPMRRLSPALLPDWLAPRSPLAHKGCHGKLLLIGGNAGLGGAVAMAGEAALRSGAGLVRVLTHVQYTSTLLMRCPELMVQALSDAAIKEGMAWADVIVIGPGLGQDDWAKTALRLVENCNKPMLWDADALNLLAINPFKRQNRILTPHAGEAARLLNCRVADIESDRLLAARKLVQRYGGTVVLKGAGTVIADDAAPLAVADVGNAGMATGGMGDVLSGIIGALLGQKLSRYDAACAGCVVHGAAADDVAEQRGARGMRATDLMPVLSRYVNPEWIPLEQTE